MANILKEIKGRIIGEVLSETELDNIMTEYRYHPLNNEESESIVKYTNYSSQIWVEVDRDAENNLLVTNLKYTTKEKDVSTRVDPFHSFDDLNKILKYFLDTDQTHHWLCSCLMTSLGRRVGDILSLKWSDIYTHKGTFRVRLTTLKEEKTKKIVGVRFHEFAKDCINEYCQMVNINPLKCYNEKIFDNGTAAFRAALKKAVNEVGLDYPISTHSFRKFYGNMMYKLHPQDADSIKMIQFMFGHSSEDITKGYIGAIDDKIDRYVKDYSDFLKDSRDKKEYVIDNSPVIVLKTQDLREILKQAYLSGKSNISGEEDIDIMNQFLEIAEKMRVS